MYKRQVGSWAAGRGGGAGARAGARTWSPKGSAVVEDAKGFAGGAAVVEDAAGAANGFAGGCGARTAGSGATPAAAPSGSVAPVVARTTPPAGRAGVGGGAGIKSSPRATRTN